MLHIIKSEFEYAKYYWMVLCLPLLLTIPALLWLMQFEGVRYELITKVTLNFAKGFGIIIALLLFRSVLGYVGQNRISSYHLKLPLSLAQIGIVRTSNVLAMWLSACILIGINLTLIPDHIEAQIFPTFLFTMGSILTLFGFALVLTDLLNIWNKSVAYRVGALIFIMFCMPILMIKRVVNFDSFATPAFSVLINILGFALIILSVYTFTRLQSYIFKVEPSQ